MGGGIKSGEPDRYSLDTLGPAALEDLGAGAASPSATLLETPALAPCTTKPHNKLLVSSPDRGLAPTTSMPEVPYDMPLAFDTPDTDTTTGRNEPGVTMARSPVLAFNNTIGGRLGDVTGRAGD
jgi:hypothetical protein